MNSNRKPTAKGRGAQIEPPKRFERVRLERDLEYLEHDAEAVEQLETVATEFFEDQSGSIISTNDSPDVPFRYSLNPYRGCAHGCAYCYARPSHEYLGFDAGLAFETKIIVKRRAPELLRDWLCRGSWQPEEIAIAGVTDCYQPCERQFRLTRGCLEVARDANQPIGIITKNALVLRDLDILRPMAECGVVNVSLSITSLEQELARTMEPRTSAPAARLRAVAALAEAGIPVSIMIAPVIPGLNDHEIPSILKAAADAGANSADYVLLRLPLAVEPVFLDWLRRTQATQAEKIISRIRSTRDGSLSNATFGERMRGKGPIAQQISQTFKVFAAKYGLSRSLPHLRTDLFRPPRSATGQMRLF